MFKQIVGRGNVFEWVGVGDEGRGVQLALGNEGENLSTAAAVHSAGLEGEVFSVHVREREHLANIADIKGVQQKIEWGSQIRNYVFMPYTLVKDTRTGCGTSNVNAVMDGALDPFIESYLNCLATGSWAQK